jgi:hypothetical protein
MHEREYTRWEATRSKGRSRFIWLFGVVWWGVVTGLMWAVMMAWMHGWNELPLLLPFALIGVPIGGYFWGAWMWNRIEKQYRQALRERRFIYSDADV